MGIPIQDCERTKATLNGSVIDKQGNPISKAEIYFENTPVDLSTPVKRTIYSDKTGHFGQEPIFFFKCEPINFTIKAAGFRKKTVSYILDYGLRNSLPKELNITLEKAQ